MNKRSDATMEDLKKEVKATTQSVRELSKQLGNISNNLGDVAEEYFYTGLQHRKILNGIKYDYVDKNSRRRGLEWDIVLENGSSVAVLEVKHKLHPKDVEEFATQKLPLFRKSLPEFSNYNVYGGVAGMAVPEDSQKTAEHYGLTVLTQDGKNLKVLNSVGFKPKTF